MEPDRFVDALAETVPNLEVFGREPTTNTPDLKISIQAIREVLVKIYDPTGRPVVRTISSCNGEPTIWAIKPIRTAGCADKTSCNGDRAASAVSIVKSMGCAIETSCNAAPAPRPPRQ